MAGSCFPFANKVVLDTRYRTGQEAGRAVPFQYAGERLHETSIQAARLELEICSPRCAQIAAWFARHDCPVESRRTRHGHDGCPGDDITNETPFFTTCRGMGAVAIPELANPEAPQHAWIFRLAHGPKRRGETQHRWAHNLPQGPEDKRGHSCGFCRGGNKRLAKP